MDYVVYSNRHEISLKDIVIGDFEEVRRFETEVEGVSVLGISVSLPRFSRLITIGIVKLEINKNLKNKLRVKFLKKLLKLKTPNKRN